jgi:hypothetical protein
MYITRYKRVCQYFSQGKFAFFTSKSKTAAASKNQRGTRCGLSLRPAKAPCARLKKYFGRKPANSAQQPCSALQKMLYLH